MKRNSLLKVKKTVAKLFTILVFVASCAPEPNQSETSTMEPKTSANVIYGTDGRLDLYQITDDRLKIMADSTVALMKTSNLTASGSVVSILGQNFGADLNLCSSERFREQDTAAFCSGTLVGPDTILTAGHCIKTNSDCQSVSFVFGFAVKSVGVLPKTVASSEIYKCAQIIQRQQIDNGADFAVIKLDRAVTNHRPLGFRLNGEVTPSDSLVVIGHPVGLPTKVTTGGTVRSVTPAGFFTANLDTYGGNSGSAVINNVTGLIEGVLVRGEQDFETKGGCTVSKVCSEGTCRGEDVTKISSVRAYLPISSEPPADPKPTPASEVFSASPNLIIPDNS